jgi:hypothetical protein
MRKCIFLAILFVCLGIPANAKNNEKTLNIPSHQYLTYTIRDLFGKDCVLYGDSIYGGDKWDEKNTKLNEDSGIKNNITRENVSGNNYCLKLSFKPNSLKAREYQATFYGAYDSRSTKGWCVDTNTTYTLKIKVDSCKTESQEITKEIYADTETTFNVRDLFGNECVLYGDSIYGGDKWPEKNKKLNKDSGIIDNITREKVSDKNYCLKLSFKPNSLKAGEYQAKFYGAYDSKGKDGWCVDEKKEYIVNVKVLPSEKEKSLWSNLGTIKTNWSFVLLVVLLVVLYLHLNKRIIALEKRDEQSTSKKKEEIVDIESIKKAVIKEIPSTSKSLTDKDIKIILGSKEIKSHIETAVSEKVSSCIETIVPKKVNSCIETIVSEKAKEVLPVKEDVVVKEVKDSCDKVTNTAPVPQVDKHKYADFYINGDNEVAVENRDLSDNRDDGMFEIIFDSSNEYNAHYTINLNRVKVTLEDVTIFSKYADIESIPSQFNSVKVVEQGELRRNGVIWKVTKKIKVKLI